MDSKISAVILLTIAYCFVHLPLETMGHPTYVPQTKKVCRTMQPHHHREAQRSTSPFKVVSYTDKVRPGESIRVSLVDDEDLTVGKDKKRGFKGFYIQARETQSDKPIGKFTATEDRSVKVHDCDHGTSNAAFHGVKGHKRNVTVEWTAPEDFAGKVVFTTTFVKKYHKFWTDVKSEPVYVRSSHHHLHQPSTLNDEEEVLVEIPMSKRR